MRGNWRGGGFPCTLRRKDCRLDATAPDLASALAVRDHARWQQPGHGPANGGRPSLSPDVLSAAAALCYMQVYNSLVSSYFGYADGSSWSTSAIEQAHNSSEWKSLSIEMTMAKRATSAHYIETTLYKQLRNQTAPLLRVNLVGIFSTRAGPGTGSYRAGTTDSMFSSPAKARALSWR